MATGDKIYFMQEILNAVHPSVSKVETAFYTTNSSGVSTMVEKTGKGVLYLVVPDQSSIGYTITVDGVEVCTNATLSYSTAVTNSGSGLPIPFNESIKVDCKSTGSYIVRYTVVLY